MGFGGAARRTINMLECFDLKMNDAGFPSASAFALPN